MGNDINRIKTYIRKNESALLQKILQKNRKITLAAFEHSGNKMYSMLHYIVWNGGNANLCQVVYDKFQDDCLHRRDKVNATPLHSACFNGNVSIVRWILNKSKNKLQDVELKTFGGETPLMWAAYGGHNDVIQLLIKVGANVNTQDSVGNTPLHAAASSSSVGALLALLHHGAESDKNSKGLSPHDVSHGIHAGECTALIKAYIYKRAKKKMNEQEINSFIDRIKVKV